MNFLWKGIWWFLVLLCYMLCWMERCGKGLCVRVSGRKICLVSYYNVNINLPIYQGKSYTHPSRLEEISGFTNRLTHSLTQSLAEEKTQKGAIWLIFFSLSFLFTLYTRYAREPSIDHSPHASTRFECDTSCVPVPSPKNQNPKYRTPQLVYNVRYSRVEIYFTLQLPPPPFFPSL